MASSGRFPSRLTVLPGGPSYAESIADVRTVIDEYLTPAAAELKRAADEHDVDAVRAYAYELLAVTGTVIAACPRPRAARPAPRP